jgi:hypothetical protein
MSAAVLESGRTVPQQPARSRLRWVAWRQHRSHAVSALALLVLITGWAWYLHRQLASAYLDYLRAGCDQESANTARLCLSVLDERIKLDSSIHYFEFALLLIPALIGVFVGAPLIAQELELGTHRLVWSQSVSRERWFAVKLALPAAGVLLFSGLITGLSAWLRAWSLQHHNLTPMDWAWYDDKVYNTIGPVPIASALFALALGTLTGLILRRTIRAMAVTAIVYAALAAGMNWLRQYLQPVHTLIHTGGYNLPIGTWLLRDGAVLPGGQWVPFAQCTSAACQRTNVEYEQYHTAAEFWPMQWVETGILLALTAALVTIAYRLLRRRSL